ncbi:MAG: histone-lysine N-methyltransferase [Spirochaetia bacterium]
MKTAAAQFELREIREPNLYRDQFPFTRVPKILFDGRLIQPDMAADIWITDTTFRDGQQARPPYTPEQIIRIYTLLHQLGGSRGLIRQSEFFLYSSRDKKAVEGCLSLGYRFPEVTGWIRANTQDLEIVKSFGLRETGILASASDYHIFLKLKKNRKKAMEDYLAIVKAALSEGIRPRVHLEDITRADIYGFCLPFGEQLLRLSEESGIPVKVRLCDTMGYGVTYPGAALPRSVPKIIYAFRKELGYPSELLEWHGHNDFHKVHINAASAWLYGVSALNAALFGYGERTGNPPLEAAVIEYIALRGNDAGIDTRVITELAEYFRNEVKAEIPENYPFAGINFNTTRAGIHADGIMKNQEIYNIFDTDTILNRPLRVTVTDKSGMAGIAQWINNNIESVVTGKAEPVTKRHPGIRNIYSWVTQQYEQGRTTGISPDELTAQAKHFLPSLFVSDFVRVKQEAIRKAKRLADAISSAPEVRSLEAAKIEPYLRNVIRREGSIQLLAVTNLEGYRISQVHTQRGEKGLFRNLMTKNFSKHPWFNEVISTGEPYYSDLFFSFYTKLLIMTAALPVTDGTGKIYAIIDIDFKFDELVKLVTDLPEEILE